MDVQETAKQPPEPLSTAHADGFTGLWSAAVVARALAGHAIGATEKTE
jgi:hypothetical protein